MQKREIKKLIYTNVAKSNILRKIFIKSVEIRLSRALNYFSVKRIVDEQKALLLSVLYSADRLIEKGCISKDWVVGLVDILIRNLILNWYNDTKYKFNEKYGYYPPGFLTISPTWQCNLKCSGCYAIADKTTTTKLPYDILNRIIYEMKEFWGAHFVVLSGGEPLVYKDKGKTILDIAEEHNNCLFLFFTNGTLINKEVAEKLAYLGNITPAISVEGFSKQTIKRRGEDVFDKIINAFFELQNVGVPFGISITATRENAHEILSDNFINFYFDKMNAMYGWIFQYMPIGRGYTPDLMVTAEQRYRMWQRMWYLIKHKKIFLVDFWNSGIVSHGCISAARSGGYLYIDWNGNVTPCVFVPYAGCNIKEIYNSGGNLNDVINIEFFKEIRKWQYEYGYLKDKPNNWLMPCAIRDHYANFKKIAEKYNPKPIDTAAAKIITDDEYYNKMCSFDSELTELTSRIWNEEYLKIK